MRGFRLGAFLAVLAGAASVVASAQSQLPLHPAPPPGKIVQEVTAFLAGDGMHSRYRVMTSRTPVGNPPEAQWYLSIYAQNGDEDYRLLYQSPSSSDPYSLVAKLVQGHGTTRYFPHETVSIVGRGQLMGEARDQVLMMMHVAAADCGTSTLSVIASEAGPGPVTVPVRVVNLCGLSATVNHHTIVLRGPYYAAGAPLYKPTKNNATATLRYVDAHWVEKPQYFKLLYPRVSETVTPLTSPTPMFTPIFKAILTTPAPSGAPAPPRG